MATRGDSSVQPASMPALADDALGVVTGPKPVCVRCGRHIPPSRLRTRRKSCGKCTPKSRGKGPGIAAIYQALTPDEWQALWRACGGRCPICRCPLRNRYDQTSVGGVACVEHDHKIEKALIAAGVSPMEALRRSIRGLMCGWDNHKVLTALRDDAAYAQRAADYLREGLTTAQAVLRGST